MSRKVYTLFSILLIVAFALSACATNATEATEAPAQPTENESSDQSAATEAPAGEKVTVTWWHIGTAEKDTALYQALADEYMAAHPDVIIEITVLENEAFKSKLTTVMQSGEPPDLFHSWGGGVLNEYASAGLLRDITPELDADNSAWRSTFGPGPLGVYSYLGQNYGVPFDMGMVGFWYNKELFVQAGIDAPPATWDELLEDVKTLKAAGITPIAIGEGDKWPGHFWWGYLITRICGKDGFEAAAITRTGSFTDPCFIEASQKLQELAALEPFQDGYLAATYGDEATAMGNGKAAMELMGQWAPAVQRDNSESKEGIGDNLAWFPFPMIEGGAGDPSDGYGGGNGYAVGKNAPDAAVDFLKFLTSAPSVTRIAENGGALPVVKDAGGVTDPYLLTIQEKTGQAKYFQLYYDQALPPALGSVVNDTVQALFAGQLTPEEATQVVEDAFVQSQ
ncbi:MAG TPA: extracellular solute-binding protein [Anaerolineales bacterium]|nr:extracellular solute-binding protein [Anaerolineales bacterium]